MLLGSAGDSLCQESYEFSSSSVVLTLPGIVTRNRLNNIPTFMSDIWKICALTVELNGLLKGQKDEQHTYTSRKRRRIYKTWTNLKLRKF